LETIAECDRQTVSQNQVCIRGGQHTGYLEASAEECCRRRQHSWSELNRAFFCVIPGAVVSSSPGLFASYWETKSVFSRRVTRTALTVSASGTPVLLYFRVTLTTVTYSIVQYVHRYLLASYSLQCMVISGELRRYHAKMRGKSVVH